MIPLLFFLLFFAGLWLVLRYWGPGLREVILPRLMRVWRKMGEAADRNPTAARMREWAGATLIAVLGVAVTAGAAHAFFSLGELLREETTVLESVDGAVYENTRLMVRADSTAFFRAMTLIGDPPVLGAISIVVAVILALRRQGRWAIYLLLTVGTGGLVNWLLKLWFARERPDLEEALRHASGYSFPSGHSMGAMLVFAAIGWLSIRILPKWREGSGMIALVTTIILAIGASRLYLGVHWLSDVVAGFAAGLAWVATITTLYEVWLRLPRRRSDPGN